MKSSLSLAAALGLFLALGHPAQAQSTVSVNFTGSPVSTDGDPSFVSFDQRAGVVPAFNFNNADGFTNGQLNTVVDNSGSTVSGLAVSYTAGTAGTNGPASTPNQSLLDGYIASSGGTAATTTVSGLPANFGTYSLYVYLTDSMNAGAASQGTYTFQSGLLDAGGIFVGNPLGTSTQTVAVATSPSDTFTPATATTAGNFLVFTGLTASTFQLSANSASGFAPINGFQIVGNAAPVPEASTLVSVGLLLACGGLAAVRRRRAPIAC